MTAFVMLRDWLHFRRTLGRAGFLRLIGAYCILIGVYIPTRFSDQGAAAIVFALIPLYLAGPLAVDAIAGERDRKTLEALLCTPLQPLNLMLGKLLFPVAAALALSLISMLCYLSYTMAASKPHAGPADLGAALALGVSLSLLCSAAGLHISLNASSSKSAQQWYSIALLVLSVGIPLGLKSLLPSLNSATAASIAGLFEGGLVSIGGALLFILFLIPGLLLAFIALHRFRTLWRMNGRSQI